MGDDDDDDGTSDCADNISFPYSIRPTALLGDRRPCTIEHSKHQEEDACVACVGASVQSDSHGMGHFA